jgi:hypothetical protein
MAMVLVGFTFFPALEQFLQWQINRSVSFKQFLKL